jgi:hypothetical protein
MVAHGAIWNPDGQSGFNSLRGALYGCEPEVTIELLQIFLKHNASPKERLFEFLRKPRMKEHVASQTYWLTRLGLKYDDKRGTKRQLPPASLLCQYNRQELYEKVWSEPALKVAKQYGFSDVRLGKVCKALWVPVPGRATGPRRMQGDRQGSVRHCLRCLTNGATVEKIGSVSAGPFRSRFFESGAPTLATPSQGVLDFLLRTLGRPRIIRQLGKIVVKDWLPQVGLASPRAS